MLETAAGKRCKGLQNMNFCSKNKKKTRYGHTPSSSQNHKHIHSWGDARDLGGVTLRSASWAMTLLGQPACGLGVAYVILSLSI